MTNDETTALTELDGRGRRAAAALRSAIPASLAEPPAPPASPADAVGAGAGPVVPPVKAPVPGTGPSGNGHGAPPVPEGGTPSPQADGPPVAPGPVGPPVAPGPVAPGPVDPDRGSGDRPPIRLVAGWRDRRGPWLAAAAVLVLAAGIVAAVLRPDGDGGEQMGMSGSELPYLVPGWLPDGWADRPPTVPVGGVELDGVDAVYGDTRADDPWAGPTVEASLSTGGPEGGPTVNGEPITVGGEEGVLHQNQVDDTWVATSGRLAVSGADRGQVVAAAPHVTDEPAIAAAGLPPGYEEIARGDMDASIGGVEFVDEGVVADYTEEGVSIFEADRGVTITQRRGEREAVDLLRQSVGESRSATVRGHHGVINVASDTVTVQWREPSGILVTLDGVGMEEDEVLRIAEALRPASGNELDRLLADYAVEDGALVNPPAPDPSLDPAEGEVGGAGLTREQMDVLRESCEDGWMASCDHLWRVTPVGSELEAVALSCGGRDPEGDEQSSCESSYPSTGSPPDTSGFPPSDTPPMPDDAELEPLRAGCEGGDMAACDDLWARTPVGSELEEFAETCGGRAPDGGHQATCASEFPSEEGP